VQAERVNNRSQEIARHPLNIKQFHAFAPFAAVLKRGNIIIIQQPD
jgi:hypothetical protein